MASEPFVDTGFEERWAAWQARGAARHDSNTRRLRTVAAIFILSAAALTTVLWWL